MQLVEGNNREWTPMKANPKRQRRGPMTAQGNALDGKSQKPKSAECAVQPSPNFSPARQKAPSRLLLRSRMRFPDRVLRNCLRACRQLGVVPSNRLLLVESASQILALCVRQRGNRASASGAERTRRTERTQRTEGTYFWRGGKVAAAFGPLSGPADGCAAVPDFQGSRFIPPAPPYDRAAEYRVSTSRFGLGQASGSYRTPAGLHRIAGKHGAGQPIGTSFRGRKPAGLLWKGDPQAPVPHRIFWLEGLDPGLNRGAGVDSHARYIYIHGVADEGTLGRPVSAGCVHLAARDLLPLHDLIPCGTLVWIE
jgi:hypothetical protein